jgi:hypothetical protein
LGIFPVPSAENSSIARQIKERVTAAPIPSR